MVNLPFADRFEAGRLLAGEFGRLPRPINPIVLAMPSGGVLVGLAVAKDLQAPLDVVVVRKLGVPWRPELAMGAITSGGFQILDEELIQELGIYPEEITTVVSKEKAEVERREKLYRARRPMPPLRGRTVVLVDDGLATGSSMLAAARYVRSLKPVKLIGAIPVGSVEACYRMKKELDQCVCLATPDPFHAVGEWYKDFRQVSEAEVQQSLTASIKAQA
jgi:putative phosphoribosyl transferase